ncbi:MAG: helix-turn-helix domain-containing protein, partial [Lachnospiraceae bacterium]|nr:helix-turn-helix domain-containing protein [Lachnospiraceae bacterium]
MISKETENKIIELCNSGICIRHIAKELNLSDGPVKRVLKEN